MNQAYPFAAFIVVHSKRTLDSRRSKLDLVWTNDKISRTDVERAVSRSSGYDLFAWLEDPDQGQTYTWSSETGPLSLVKVPFPPRPDTESHHFHIITALSDHGVSEARDERSFRPRFNRQSSSFPSQEGDQWHLINVAPPISPAGPVTDCAILLETADWSKTSLGPRETWGTALATMVEIIMASPTPESLWVGGNFNMI